MKKFILVFSLVLISACGGGSDSGNVGGGDGGSGGGNGGGTGGGNGGNNNQWTFSVGSTAVTISENATALIPFTVTGGTGVTVSTEITGSGAVSSTVIGNEAQVTVTDLQKEGVATLTLTAKDSTGKTEVKSVALILENTSVKPLLADIATYNEQSVELSEMLIEQRVILQLGKLAFYTGVYSQTRFDELIVQTSKTDKEKEALQAILNDDLRASYAAGTVNEDELHLKFQQAIAAYDIYHEPVRAALKSVSADAGLSVLNLSAPAFDPSSKKLSSILGNADLGAYQNGQWIFSSNYKYLTTIVFPNTCSI